MNFRPPRIGDLMAVRTTDPYLDEVHVVVDRVADHGSFLLISGAWGEHDLEVVVRRVGEHQHQPMEH
jgi:hypothetical protein